LIGITLSFECRIDKRLTAAWPQPLAANRYHAT